MNISTPFIRRPVATTLLTASIVLAGAVSYFFLPVSALPQVEFPTISVSTSLPGASATTMASAVATPLERQFGRIAGITEMSSTSTLGATSVTMQFELDRDIDAAARDVQAAINAARGQLPSNLPNNPTWRKVNPADAPVLILALTSDTYDKPAMYDAASSILQQRLAQVQGVGQVYVSGGSPPAVRVEVNPAALNNLGLGLEDVRTMLASANANRPKGMLEDDTQSWSISATDQVLKAKDYEPLIITFREGAPVRIKDVATVTQSVEDVRASGLSNLKPSVLLIIFRQPGANIIETVDRVYDLLPQLEEEIPADIDLSVVVDRTKTIRASVEEVQKTLLISIALVILVVFIFLRDARATFIPSVAVPVSLVGTFGVMYLAGYGIDNLSLMALTISTGFVVDDAIVVIENINRHLEEGKSPMEAALLGAREIGFTVLSISLSLVAVFIPILLMGGIVGRLFREFAVTISVAIAVSLVVSLTTTPMMCAWLLKHRSEEKRGYLYRSSEWVFQKILDLYGLTLRGVLRHQFIVLLITLSTIALTVHLYGIIPNGFFPQQDSGRLTGSIIADQDTSFQTMDKLLMRFATTVSNDPDVIGVTGYTGGSGMRSGSANTATMFVALRPLEERELSVEEVMARLRKTLSSIPGATLFLQSVQDLRLGGRSSSAQYQYTLQGDSLEELNEWGPKFLEKLRGISGIIDVNSDQLNGGLQANVIIDRTAASRLGISQQAIDDALYDAFGQRQVSTMYTQLNQYHVVMTVPPEFWSGPQALEHLYVRGTNGVRAPLSAFAKFDTGTGPLAVNHSAQFPSVTYSFNLQPGTSLGGAVEAIDETRREMGMPATIQGKFQGAAQAFQESLANQPVLILAAIFVVYIVLGILYESYIHPITILSTLPSAGVGALLALMLCKTELNVMGMIGILLLIGIVKKNAIMMIDFALDAERKQDLAPQEAIYNACIMRFRPIIMTTLAALLGALPLAMGTGMGAELRRPLGIAIVGGLIVSQALTLYTTPVVYLYLDRMRLWYLKLRGKSHTLPELQPQMAIEKPTH